MILLDLYLARHGQSYGNLPLNGVSPPHHVPLEDRPLGLETGRMEDDWHLTPLGQQQAEALGERLSALPFDTIICSPLERAHATAKAVQARQPKPIELQIERDVLEIHDCGTDTPEEWHERALRATQKLRENHPPGARVLVVAHGGFNNFLLHALLGLAGPDLTFRFAQHNTGLSRILFQNEAAPAWERVKLVHMNNLNHLPPELIT